MPLAKPVDKNKWPALCWATNNILIYSPRTVFCFFQLSCKLQLSQLKEPINSGPSGTMVQTMNSTIPYRWLSIYEKGGSDCSFGRIWATQGSFPHWIHEAVNLQLNQISIPILKNIIISCEQISHRTLISDDGVGILCTKGMREVNVLT